MSHDIDWNEMPGWTYHLTSPGGLDSVGYSPESLERVVQDMAQPPKDKLKKALSAYKQAFFPRVHLALPPWQQHGKLHRATEKKRRAFAEQRWRLAWYWKAMYYLALQKNWEAKDRENWFVRISQVRDWAFAYFYKESTDGKQELLRPPIFGRSNRLLRFDSYYVLLSFVEDVSAEWNLASKVPEKLRHAEQSFVLGRTDFIYRLDNIEEIPGDGVSIKVRASLDLHPFRIAGSDKKIKAISGLEAKELPEQISYPYEIVWTPSAGSAGKGTKERAFLLSSPAVCRAFEKLSEVWNDSTARSVLIIAPPGSGKELLAGSIHELRHFKGQYCIYALSPTDHEGNNRMLYTRETDNPEVKNELMLMTEGKPNLANPVHHFRDGCVFKARQGVLFLDEIDKVSDQTRSSLLRLLESNDCAIHGTPIVVSVKDFSPLFVFAGSMGHDSMFKLSPSDFWSRISHVVTMEHPMDADATDDRERIARSYFHYFWIQHVFDSCNKTRIAGDGNGRKDEHRIATIARRDIVALIKFMLSHETIDFFSRIFAQEICSGREKVEFSIRNIRNTVARMYYALVDYFVVDRNYDNTHGRIHDSLLKAGATINVYECLRKLMAEENPGSRKVTKVMAESFRTEMRGIMQASIAKVLS